MKMQSYSYEYESAWDCLTEIVTQNDYYKNATCSWYELKFNNEIKRSQISHISPMKVK